MKKTLLLILIIFPLYILFSQGIKGKIVNDVDQPISEVNVYLDGTKTATISQQDGSFSLQTPNLQNGILVFQKDNYETFTMNTSEAIGKTLKVVLLKSKSIEEVKIVPFTEKAYKDYIGYFLDTFIGEDKENVRIKNQRSLKFSFDKENKILKVKAPQILIIENKNLGYLINYNLVDFKADLNENMTSFIGTSFFKETKNSNKIKLNRMNAYDGSLVHFFRSVYNKKTAEEGFIVNHVTKFPNANYPTEEELQKLKDFAKKFKETGQLTPSPELMDIAKRKRNEQPYKIAVTKTKISESDYIKTSEGKVILDFKDVLMVNYKKYYFELKNKDFVKSKIPVNQSSYIFPEGETFEIDNYGNTSKPGQLMTQGDFTKNKIENLLPLDYNLGD